MVDEHWTTKVGDTQTPLEAKLTERDPAVAATPANPDPRRGIDLTVAVSVTLKARTRDKQRAITGVCAPFTPGVLLAGDDGKGWVRWTPDAPSVAAKGTFNAEFKVLWPGGAQQTVPNSGTFQLEIEEAIT